MTQRSDQVSETLIGAAVLAVAIGFLGFALVRAGEPSAGAGYPLYARFDRVDGVAVGSDVRLAGVKIGSVSSVALDSSDYRARVELTLSPGVQVPEDSVARVASDGLLGGAYVSIDPGGSDTMLAAKSEFYSTQGSVDLLTLFASFARGQGGSEQQDAPAEEAAP